MSWKCVKNTFYTEMNWKTEQVHGVVLSDRDLNINKIWNVDRVLYFLTHLHNFGNQCAALRLVTAVAAVFIMKVNLITRKSVVTLLTRVVINIRRSSSKVNVILSSCNQTSVILTAWSKNCQYKFQESLCSWIEVVSCGQVGEQAGGWTERDRYKRQIVYSLFGFVLWIHLERVYWVNWPRQNKSGGLKKNVRMSVQSYKSKKFVHITSHS
jgi:hypothetical protein